VHVAGVWSNRSCHSNLARWWISGLEGLQCTASVVMFSPPMGMNRLPASVATHPKAEWLPSTLGDTHA